MKRKHYSTDLTDREWAIIEPLVPAPKPGGRPCRWDRREILNGIYYVVRSGGRWGGLPHYLAPWQKGDHYFLLWRRPGQLLNMHKRVPEQVRTHLCRHPTPPNRSIAHQS